MPNDVMQAALPQMKNLRALLEPFSKANQKTATRQLLVALIFYIAGWAAMYYSLHISYFLTLLLAVPTAGFLMRIFIIFHDCGHGSFFQSTKLNRRIGFWMGVLVFTPGEDWWRTHAIHHATSGNLDKRGIGDVATLTVDEYQKLSPAGRFGYRLFRHPLIMFGLGPVWMFLIRHRWPSTGAGRKETMSVIWTNLAIVIIATGLSLLMGVNNYILIQLPIIWLGGMVGIWMFYIQHQFESVYWARDKEWNFLGSAFLGASCYRLPKVFQWFSGNIGFHHIHHLNPRVPNYQLDRAYHSTEALRQAPTFNFRQSLNCIRFALIDERLGKMVSFQQAGLG
jgi:omega-6 fatty acid desaturase (delta-12 desaturase)